MLTLEEKAYCRALEALKRRDYSSAEKEMAKCGNLLSKSRGLTIILEATQLLLTLRREKDRLKHKRTIKETLNNGEKTIFCRQSLEEEAHKPLPGLQ